MSSGPPTPQQGDPFAPSYMHPSGNSSHPFPPSDPFSQASSAQPPYGQPLSGQAHYDQTSFGQSSFSQPSFGQPSENQPSFGRSSAGQLPSGQPSVGQPPFGQSSFGQAPQMPQQQAPGQGGSVSHNPFAAAAGAFGGSSVNAGEQACHSTLLQTLVKFYCLYNFVLYMPAVWWGCRACLTMLVSSTHASRSDQALATSHEIVLGAIARPSLF